jgi:hypothetical protein
MSDARGAVLAALGYRRGRGVWRVEEAKVQEFIDEAYRKTAEAIAKGEVDDERAED